MYRAITGVGQIHEAGNELLFVGGKKTKPNPNSMSFLILYPAVCALTILNASPGYTFLLPGP